MMTAGSIPLSWDSPLTGFALRLYNKRIEAGIINPNKIVTVVNGVSYPESDNNYQERIFKAKKMAYYDALSIIEEIQANAEVKLTTLNSVPIGSGSGSCAGAFIHAPGPTNITVLGNFTSNVGIQ